MSTNALSRERSSGNSYRLESRAFYLGAHNIDPEPVMQEIEAKMVQDASEEREKLLRALRALEAKKEQVRRERPEAEATWARVKKELGDTPPPFFHALVMLVFAFSALADQAAAGQYHPAAAQQPCHRSRGTGRERGLESGAMATW